MDEEHQQLARRAMACRRWQWMPGMLAWCPHCGSRRVHDGTQLDIDCAYSNMLVDVEEPWDACTLGCLLALVREAWGNDDLYCERYVGADFDGWIVRGPNGPAVSKGQFEVDALVAALEAAP